MREFRQNSSGQNKIKKTAILGGALIVLILIAVVAKVKFLNSGKQNQGKTLGDQVTINDPLKTVTLNKELQFPVKDSKGKEVTKFKYMIEKVDVMNEIVVKGQKATAVQGRAFLIISLKITNEYSQKLDINTRNYVRLSLNGNQDEWLAPDIHNDPVEVQAQSTKLTRIGFPINTNDTKMVLRVGEIDGDKQMIDLNF